MGRLRSRNNGCLTWIAILFALSFIGNNYGQSVVPLLIIIWVASLLLPAIRRSMAPPQGNADRQAPATGRHQPVIDLPAPAARVEPAAEPLPRHAQPASGETLDIRLSFEAADAASIAQLVPHFVGDDVTVVSADRRALPGGQCVYSYRLIGPESILKELCEVLEARQYHNVTAFW